MVRKYLNESERIFVVFGYCSEPYYRYLKHINNLVVMKDSKLRGTAGQLITILEKYDDVKNVLVLNGDLLISSKCLENIVSEARTSKDPLTMFLLKRKFKYGVIDLSGDKPRWIEKPEFLTVTGIYSIDAKVLYKIIREIGSDYIDMNKIVEHMWNTGLRVGYKCLECGEDDIVDIGTPLDFIKSLSLLSEDDIYDPSTRC